MTESRKQTESQADAPSRLAAVRQEIAQACAAARRDPADVTLVAVSKTFGANAIAQVLAAGHGAMVLNLHRDMAIGFIALVIALKVIACLISLASGFRGGLFFASLFLGTLVGQLYAGVADMASIEKLSPENAALVGMGAFAVNADQAGVAPPQGSALLLEVAADGVQIYTCEAKGSLFQWIFTAPEAKLFDKQGRQIGTHFAGPTWKIAEGAVVGEVAARADAPAGGAIPWLLLRAKSHEGSGVLPTVAFIRRADTKGGAAPAAGCDSAHSGAQARVRYSAVYQFYGAAK